MSGVDARGTLDDILTTWRDDSALTWVEAHELRDLREKIMAAFRFVIPEDLITEGVRERSYRGACTHHLTVVHSTEEPCPWPT